ncbi:spirocyclase AveC family protein [Mycobacterium sp.]|uniref:spirocyclase AveC family protein n=1 Tax=Mycobacterium sp. TaxID=1785 RepID=UPI0012231190|nr:spirocyclase AveC family protein [Mycobacterium sp.]TAM64425.1 MAG: spirocyclase, AveC family [Mycobacterium sp.]
MSTDHAATKAGPKSIGARLSTRMAEPQSKRSRPVLWWAALGAATIAFQAYIYIAWIISDDFKATPTGADPVPHMEKVFAWILQSLLAALALISLWWVIRGCSRAGRMTLDAKLLIAGYCQLWLDPIGSAIRPQFFFNSYYVNRGSWLGQIPGAMTPNGHLLADLLLVELPVYGSLIGICVGGCALIRWMRARRPQTSNVALLLWVWLVLGVFIFVFEAIFVMRTGAAVWLAPTHSGTIFYGTRYQMSIIPDPLFWSVFMVAMIGLRFFATDKGAARTDAGLDQLGVAPRWKTTISTLAVVGFVSAAMFVSSALAIGASLYSKTPDNLPSYLRDGICGEGTNYECPNPGVPIQTVSRPEQP